MAKYIVHNGISIASESKHRRIGNVRVIGPEFLLTLDGKRIPFVVFQSKWGDFGVCPLSEITSGEQEARSKANCNWPKYPKGLSNEYPAEHNIWAHMLQRCGNPNDEAYGRYGGAGVCVCPQWHFFPNFLRDMGPRPGPEYSIDRYPIRNGDYCPGNCRWATDTEQANNRKSNKEYEYQGRTQNLMQWCIEFSVSYWAMRQRLRTGKSFEEAINMAINCPPGPCTKKFPAFGQEKTMREWADLFAVNFTMLEALVKGRQYSVEKALSHLKSQSPP